jgi:uncharacterized protein YecA (UPF0149 family)
MFYNHDIFVSFFGDNVQEWKKTTNKPRENPQVKAIKVGRNDPCPCGSGQKLKKCWG